MFSDGSVEEDPFPAGAGMNRRATTRETTLTTVPRRRGDEPDAYARYQAGARRSPQARG